MRQALFQPESATMSYSEPPDGARNCLPKFVRLGTHREPITDPRDFSVYAVIMSNVTIEREALFNVLSGRHGCRSRRSTQPSSGSCTPVS